MNRLSGCKSLGMDIKKKANLIIYRFREQGLEIFLVNPSEDGRKWEIPQGKFAEEKPHFFLDEERLIELDPIAQENGGTEEAWAVEGEWHDIPSLKAMLYEDAVFLKEKLKGMEKGTYFAIKEAFKKVLPHQYKFLKELKDILVDRNSIRDL
jgi:predicted NUDIX family NTP pyrophosphohydrolase